MTVQLLASEPAGNGMTRVTLFDQNTRVQALIADSLLGAPNRDAVFQVLLDTERTRLARAAAIVAPGVTP